MRANLLFTGLFVFMVAAAAAAQRPRVILRAQLDSLRGDSTRPITRVSVRGIDTLPRRIDSVALAPGQLLTVDLPRDSSALASPVPRLLPVRYLTMDQAGRILLLRPVVQVDPLLYEGTARAFTGPLRLGVEDSVRPAAIVHVTLPLEAGSTERVVRLAAGRATPEPAELTLTGGETRDVRVRSVGITPDTLYGESAPFRSDRLVLTYQWPVRLLVAALFGSCFGLGLMRITPRSTRPTASLPRFIAAGLAIGCFVAAAYAVGVNLTGIKITTPYGDAVIAVVSALGAMFGVRGKSIVKAQ